MRTVTAISTRPRVRVAHLRHVVDDLLEGGVAERVELHLDHAAPPRERQTDRRARDAGLADRRVEDAIDAELALQPVRHPEDAADAPSPRRTAAGAGPRQGVPQRRLSAAVRVDSATEASPADARRPPADRRRSSRTSTRRAAPGWATTPARISLHALLGLGLAGGPRRPRRVSGREQPGAVPRDRVDRAGAVDLGPSFPVPPGVVGGGVCADPVGPGLDQGRAVAERARKSWASQRDSGRRPAHRSRRRGRRGSRAPRRAARSRPRSAPAVGRLIAQPLFWQNRITGAKTLARFAPSWKSPSLAARRRSTRPSTTAAPSIAGPSRSRRRARSAWRPGCR